MGSIEKFEITYLSIFSIIDKIDIGEIALPDIQRPFIWDTTKVRDLVDSLYNGLPIGSIILWELYKPQSFKQININNKKEPFLLVIDGQQRLTSLYSIIKNKEIMSKDIKKIKIKIAFNPFIEKFEVSNPIIEKDKEWISDISEIFFNTSFQFIKKFKERFENDIDKIIFERIEKVLKILDYSLSIIKLKSDLDPEEVSEIFIRINSKGKPLNESDFILTLLSVYSPEEREKIENFCRESYKPAYNNKISPFNLLNINPTPSNLVRTITSFSFKRGRLKYAFLMLQGRDLEKKELTEDFRNKSLEDFRNGVEFVLDLKNWHNYVKIIYSAGFVNQNLISSKINFFITYSLYLIGKKDYRLEDKFLERLIKKWFIFSQLTQRYTGSPETVIEDDLKNIINLNSIEDYFYKTFEKYLTNDFWEITLLENLRTSSSNQFAFVTYIASLINEDLKVLFSDIKLKDYLNPLIKTKKKIIELHHIYPKNYLKKLGYYNKKDINQVANLIYIEYKDNIKVFGDKEPSIIWPNLLEEFYKNNIESVFYSYDLPNNFWELPYEEFLDYRRKLMAQRIRKFFESI